ncbi:MAG: beta-ketoacyl-[acyl-carrier-protein] synthase family protein [Proteobacteria bacterium]|jgi:3-oxoacyl-[acyl-carrier-protein] synthase II|nr:beta-ketoacyl-[acyl-carrier-protein] synthase family protein [Desulfocapsa sp.]MBU3944229.1 beta-ketoacyl-[acyl-carrier-protein] synthase family protein [Pseudomonadota bacterium]MCG2743792.1 beta-ketoacyl-[acyl-carrier-protein] synthase family protein [Desulfobacteraceae bacterium]MBU4028830.1 beta-ketoacyl-[acyl-carrier-protein] synthase family protein [Pseudomonadota bacterium]MBU4041734.1 beta-ketoacyl-[acyl-carrier-protein] synthase family protein [Pseudomonadota bacterium]
MDSNQQRIVITGVGLAAPNADNLKEFRKKLLAGISEIKEIDLRYFGPAPAGICTFDETKYRKKKDNKRGTRAGCLGVYCAHEAMADATLDINYYDRSRIGVYVGLTEHGTVETENEIFNISQYNYDVNYWTHHHNPRTVLNNPPGEITMSLGITGPHYAIGAACAAGNASLIQGVQMLRLGEVDMALAGGISESTGSFGIFASFKAQGALAEAADPRKACRPFDMGRNGIVVSEGGCIYVLERLEKAIEREARIYGEIVGYCINSDARDFVLPYDKRQAECMQQALNRAGLNAADIDIINTHATGTRQGDIEECKAIRQVFGEAPSTYINNTKSIIGHAMGAAGVLELAGNLSAFEDNMVHPTINVTNLDPECALPNMVLNKPTQLKSVSTILNNSFGMVGINSVIIVKKYED